MWTTFKSLFALLTSYGLLLLGNGMINILLGLRSRLEGFSTETTGFIMSGFFLGMLTGALLAVRVVAAVGHIRAFAAFASVMSVAVLAHVLLVNPVVWFLLRLVAGFCMAGMVMVVESWLNERASNEMRGRVLSVYMMTNYLGAGLGQFMMLAGDPGEFELFVLASMIYSFALVPVLLTRSNAPKPVAPVRMPFRELIGVSPVGVVGTICAAMVVSSLNGMGAVFAREVGLSIPEVSTFMAAAILGGMLLQFPVGRLSDRFDRRTVLIVACLSTAAAGYGVTIAPGNGLQMLLVAAVVYGGFSFTIYPLCASQVNDLADKDRLVQVASGLLIAYGVGASMGPTVAAQFMAYAGPVGLFYYVIAITLFLAAFTLLRIFLRRRGDKEKAGFLPLGSLGVSSKQLYSSALKNPKD